ncbi:MAG TPA: tetratricopeptide repeat protein [Terriglobia bacterium]|nr:tetratricopeptide repeat protein [Terriglobia bacterium]
MNKQERKETEAAPGWTAREAYLMAVVSLLAGLFLGYMLHTPSAPTTAEAATSSAPAAAPAVNPMAAPTGAEAAAAPLKLALSSDPKNYELLVQLGNLYYDKQAYAPAIEYYRRALELRPNEVNVRTDLGTAYWYTGLPQNAIAEYQKSLQTDPGHEQTLFNMGVVYKDGLKDPSKAIAAWEKLLKLHPDYSNRDRAQALIEEARKQTR